MSLIAASAEALAEGKHAALADLHFLLTLDESIVNAAEKQTTKAQLLEGKLFENPFYFQSFSSSVYLSRVTTKSNNISNLSF